MLVEFHPKLCKEIMSHAGLNVFLAFCRPLGLVDNDTIFVEMETDSLIKTLFKFFSRLDENSQKYDRWCLFPEFLGLVNDQYAIGNYVFEILIAKGFANIVELFLTNLKQSIFQINLMDIKEFLDGLLNKGERSSIVSQFKTFFEAVLFKYGSIPVILQVSRPLTSSISSQNIIKVDEKFLAGKLSAYFESSSSSGIAHSLKMFGKADIRENGTYYVFWDNHYFEKKFENEIAKYFLKYGFNSNNDKLVQIMYEQFVSYDDEQITDEESEDDDLDKCTDEVTSQEGAAEDCGVNGKKIVFDDYPADEFRVNANGMIIHSQGRVGSLKKIFFDPMEGPTYNSRLYKFLSFLKFKSFRMGTPRTLMELLRLKFKTLLDSINPDRSSASSDYLDYCDDSDSDYGYWCD